MGANTKTFIIIPFYKEENTCFGLYTNINILILMSER